MKLKNGVIIFLILFTIVSPMFQFIDIGICAYIYRLSPNVNSDGYISNRVSIISVNVYNMDNTVPTGSMKVRLRAPFLSNPVINDSIYNPSLGSNIVYFSFSAPDVGVNGQTFQLDFDEDTLLVIQPTQALIIVKIGIYCDVTGEPTQSYSVSTTPDIILNVKFYKSKDNNPMEPSTKECIVTEGASTIIPTWVGGNNTGEYICKINLQVKNTGYYSFKIFGSNIGETSINVPSFIRILVAKPKIYLKIVIGNRPPAYINKDGGISDISMSEQTIDIYSLNSKYEDAKGITITQFKAVVEGLPIDLLPRLVNPIEIGYHWRFQFVFTKALTTFIVTASLSNYEPLSTSFKISAMSAPDLITQILFNPLTFIIIGVIIAVVIFRKSRKKTVYMQQGL